jgi:hypothetical protein
MALSVCFDLNAMFMNPCPRSKESAYLCAFCVPRHLFTHLIYHIQFLSTRPRFEFIQEEATQSWCTSSSLSSLNKLLNLCQVFI